ncbi:MAG: SbcC/MukB-like Walker B domain-containing protein [Methylomonas sp.]|nr:SbcC/MukB-like Walker B domain-containing protein [Methylomonas sp.]
MRILNISFKNINSLEGEGRIYFDQGPIADSGVFAITGPNGSGKSSILDVITLGLYGETFRFDRPAAHVMTKQTHECFASVEFSLGDEKFRSSWEAKRDVTPGALPVPALPNMKLARINGQEEILAETPSQVRNRIAELTGMDFHRFSKSILLPQGDFAAFLNALDCERMDILEKIYGPDIYAVYRQQSERQLAQAQARMTQLHQDIAGLPLLGDDAIEAATHDLQDFKDQVAEFKLQQQQTKQQLATAQNIAQLELQQQQLRLKHQDLLIQISHYQQDLDKIASHQFALQFRTEIDLLDDKQAQMDKLQATLDDYRKELAMLQQQLGSDWDEGASSAEKKSLAEQKQAVDALKLSISELKLELPRQRELAQSIQQQLNDNQAALSEVDGWLLSHQRDASLVDDFPDIVRLRNLRNELVELKGKQKSHANWAKNTTAALKKNKTALETTQSDLAELTEQIDIDRKTLQDLADGRSLDELKELQQEQQSRVGDLQEMHSLASATAKLTDKGWLSWLGIKKQTDIPPNEIELQSQLDELTQEMSREQNIIKVLEQALRNEALIKKMSADRAKLIAGQPCYLCGSIEHPFVSKPPIYTDARKALLDQRGKIQGLKSRIEHAATQLKAAQKYGSQLSAKQQRLLQMHSQWTVLANRLNVMRDGMEIGNLSLQKQFLSEETEELNKLNDLIKQHAQLQRNLARMTAEVDDKKASLEKLGKTVEGLESAWNNRPAEFDEIEKQLTEHSAEETALIAKLESQLGTLGEKLPTRGKENPLFDRLTSRRQDYQVYQLRQQGLQKEMAALNEKLQDSQNRIATYQQQISDNLEALSQQERLSLHIAIIEKQKLIVDQEQHWRITQIETKAILQALTDRMAGSGFETVDELKDLVHLIEQENVIRQRLEDSNALLKDIERQRHELLLKLEEESVAADSRSIDDIQQELGQIENKIDIAGQEILTLGNKLDKQQQYREKIQSLRQEIDQQQQLFAAAEAEMTLINDDPSAFRQKIQSIMADQLLSQTNQILEKLSGRYYVRSGTSHLGLALEIEDTLQKNLRRLPQTLSGGESFVVSLALALALAEIANNGKAIHSLFLDEGFGSLDAESLYLAMSTLENLKTHGKTVGIISHVEGVKKRIKTQIELVKKPNGLSELKMVA